MTEDPIEAYFSRGRLYQELGSPIDAIEEYEKALVLDPENLLARAHLGSALYDAGSEDRAEDEFRRVLDNDPKHFLALSGMGLIMYQRGRYVRAREFFERILPVAERYPFAFFMLANTLRELQQFEKSAHFYRKMIEHHPEHRDSHFFLGLVHLVLDANEEAAYEMRRTLEIDPKFAPALYHMGRIRERSGEAEKALADYRRAAEHATDDAEILTRIGNLEARLGNREKAAKNLERAVELEPESVFSLNSLAAFRALEGRFDDSMELFERSLKVDPEESVTYAGMARLYELMGNSRLEMENLVKATKLDPGSTKSMRDLALSHFAEGQFDKAEPLLKKLVRAVPDAWELHQLLGYCCLARGERERAAYQFQRVLESGRANAETYYYLGRLAEMGIRPVARPKGSNSDQAKKMFRMALENNPLHLGTLNHLGEKGKAPAPAGPIEDKLVQPALFGVSRRFTAGMEILAVETKFLFRKRQVFFKREELSRHAAKRGERVSGWLSFLFLMGAFAAIFFGFTGLDSRYVLGVSGLFGAIMAAAGFVLARRARAGKIVVYNAYTGEDLFDIHPSNPSGEAVESFIATILKKEEGSTPVSDPGPPGPLLPEIL